MLAGRRVLRERLFVLYDQGWKSRTCSLFDTGIMEVSDSGLDQVEVQVDLTGSEAVLGHFQGLSRDESFKYFLQLRCPDGATFTLAFPSALQADKWNTQVKRAQSSIVR